MIEWLLSLDQKVVTLMQFASSTMLTVAGFVVGLVALNFGYRNNFGWKPIVLVLSRAMTMDDDGKEAGAEFEVWNRQKYPIVIRTLQLTFAGLEFVGLASEDISYAEHTLVRWGRASTVAVNAASSRSGSGQT